MDWSAVDYLDDTSWVRVPTLVVHGTGDPRVPVTVSQQLAAAEPELVTLETFPDALHVESWNFDRARYTDLVGVLPRHVELTGSTSGHGRQGGCRAGRDRCPDRSHPL